MSLKKVFQKWKDTLKGSTETFHSKNVEMGRLTLPEFIIFLAPSPSSKLSFQQWQHDYMKHFNFNWSALWQRCSSVFPARSTQSMKVAFTIFFFFMLSVEQSLLNLLPLPLLAFGEEFWTPVESMSICVHMHDDKSSILNMSKSQKHWFIVLLFVRIQRMKIPY